jgi:hypothetical protein
MIKSKSRQVNILLLFVILGGSLLKCIYALTRNVFPSGPDAPGFIPPAENFAQFGFFGESVDLSTIYSAGYPFFLSFFSEIGGEGWYKAAQVGQIILFALGTLIMARTLMGFGYSNGAIVFAFVLSLHPGWLVATSMAMYESLLFFLFAVFFGLISKRILNPTSIDEVKLGLFIGTLSGAVILVHPRGILFFLPFLCFGLLKKNKIIRFLIPFLLTLGLFLSMTIIRTHLDSGTFNLGGDVWAASWIGRENLELCRNTFCYLNTWITEPIDSLIHSLKNLWYFLTPYSGPTVKGTWFHNISLQYYLYSHGHLEASLIVAYLLTIMGILLFGASFVRLVLDKSKRKFHLLKPMTVSLLLVSLTDMLVYGDNRHRLIIVPIVLFLHVLANFNASKLPLSAKETKSHQQYS